MDVLSKKEALNRLRGLVVLKKLKIESKEANKVLAIEEILKNDNCFKDLNVEAAYGILRFLDINEEDIPYVYAMLLNEDEEKPSFYYLVDVSNQKELSKVTPEIDKILSHLRNLLEIKKKDENNLTNLDKIKIKILTYFLNPPKKENPFVGLSYTLINDVLTFLNVEEKDIKDYYLKLSQIQKLLIPKSQVEKVEIL